MDSTKIQWTEATWNPVRGCSRVSAGCDNCYAMRQAHRQSRPGAAYDGLTRIGKRGVDWAGFARLVPEQLDQPLRWKRPRKIFVNSMSDLFHESLTFEEIAAVWGIMHEARQHTFQVLTKRPKRAAEFFAWVAAQAKAQRTGDDYGIVCQHRAYMALEVLGGHNRFPLHHVKETFRRWPWPSLNVWLGVSGENQKTVDDRASVLLELPAAVRFISLEPLLEEVTIWAYLKGELRDRSLVALGGAPMHGLDWVIVGGESGNGARLFDVTWAEDIVRQCRDANVACFVKQLGAVPFDSRESDRTTDEPHPQGAAHDASCRLDLSDRKGGDMAEWPEPLRVRQFPEVSRG